MPRRLARRLLGAFVLFQLIVPLTYYLRDDPYDERFAWRMFSAIRLNRCQISARDIQGEQETEIPLDRVIHRAWINTLKRSRRDVVEAFLARRCEEPEVEAVILENRCIGPSGARQPALRWRQDCESGEIEESAQ